MKMNVRIGDRTFAVEIADLAARPIRASVDGEVFEVWPEPPAGGPAPVLPAAAEPAAVAAPAPAAPPASAANANSVLAPIPGVIVSVAVQPGQPVTVGQELCVLEAMKMKSPIRSPRAGRVQAVHVSAGQQVKHREVLVDYAD